MEDQRAEASPVQGGPFAASKSWRGLMGAVAAGVSLGVSELLAGGFDQVPSLVVGVGQWIIDGAPLGFIRLGIDVFGTSDKPALVVGIVLLALLTARYLASRPPQRSRWLVPAGFAAGGLFGALAAARPDSVSLGASLLAGSVSAGAGIGVWALDRRSAPGDASTVDVTRRDLLIRAGAGAAAAVVLGAIGRRLADRLGVESARSAVVLARVDDPLGPTTGDLPVPGITPHITPRGKFYRIDSALVVPQVDPDGWTLKVTGLVERELELSFSDLLEIATTEKEVTLACVSNQVGGDLISNARWQGVPLGVLLDRAGVLPSAEQVVGRSVDGWTAGFPIEVAHDGRPALVAVGMNGAALPVKHGFPARLVVSGLYGYVSATKWLDTIELTTWAGHDGYWIPRGWSKRGPIKTQSRIDLPSQGARLVSGNQTVAGVAWAQGRGVAGVEVSVDDGPWLACELADAGTIDTWRQWAFAWVADPGPHQLAVRAIDENGEVQTSARTGTLPDGATGHHTITVQVTEQG